MARLKAELVIEYEANYSDCANSQEMAALDQSNFNEDWDAFLDLAAAQGMEVVVSVVEELDAEDS